MELDPIGNNRVYYTLMSGQEENGPISGAQTEKEYYEENTSNDARRPTGRKLCNS